MRSTLTSARRLPNFVIFPSISSCFLLARFLIRCPLDCRLLIFKKKKNTRATSIKHQLPLKFWQDNIYRLRSRPSCLFAKIAESIKIAFCGANVFSRNETSAQSFRRQASSLVSRVRTKCLVFYRCHLGDRLAPGAAAMLASVFVVH